MNDDFAAVWNSFCRELDTRSRRLRKEVEASWNGLDLILQKHADKFTPDGWDNLPKNSLPSILETIGGKGSVLLFEPLLSLRKGRSHERALSAIGNYPTDIEDVLRLLPQTLTISRADLAGFLSLKKKPFGRFIPGFGRKPRTFQIRAAARSVLDEYLNARIKWDGRMSLLLARASLSLFVPWGLFRNEALKSIKDVPYRFRDLSGNRDEWIQLISAFRVKAENILASCDVLEKRLPERLAGAVFSDRRRSSERRLTGIGNRWRKCFSNWSALQRAVVAEIELQYSSGKLLETAIEISSESLASIDEEHVHILDELDRVRRWLGAWRRETKLDPFPPPEARLMGSEDRAAAWNRRVAAAARAALPVHVEFMDIEHILPGRHPSLRSLDPENSLVKSLSDIGRGIALAGFREAEEGHRAIIREIERAREVVAYSIESDDEETGADLHLAEEGIQNAVSLLDYQRQSVADFHPVVERRLAEAIAGSFFQFHMSIDKSKLGLLKYLASQKGGKLFRTLALSAYDRIKTGLRLLWDKGNVYRDRALISLGWAPPSTASVEPVRRREYLGELLRLAVVPRELPALYKRLFRLAPVEDPRFLVGRDAEMAAMVQSRQQWEEGRPVSILIAGARGSGKTSLLNCAQMAVFSDLPIISGHFYQRISTPAELYAFMASLFQADSDGLRPFLKSGKRIVILEEVERTFIRRIGGFQALRTLLSLISATSKNTLWILSMNQSALRFLENIIPFEENFSHRINAMAVAPEHLTNAILLRHNLSGLRLQLMSPESGNSRFDAVRRILGLEKDAEQSYFESLYRQSEGVFRSAFELWLQSVDRVEGGVLHMLSPMQPDYGKMLAQLTQEDAFKLQAIQQHGSLTAEELALVFDESIEKSGQSIDKLTAWDVLENDPNSPGSRIRPAAGRFVRNALYRRNLL